MKLRTHLEFVSDAFPPYPNEDEEINPGIWGKRLAQYVREQLAAKGVRTLEQYAEDWGWVVPVCDTAFKMFIGCSNQLESGGNRFLCLIDPAKPWARAGFFRKVSTVADIERVGDAIYKAMELNPQIKELRFWENDGG